MIVSIIGPGKDIVREDASHVVARKHERSQALQVHQRYQNVAGDVALQRTALTPQRPQEREIRRVHAETGKDANVIHNTVGPLARKGDYSVARQVERAQVAERAERGQAPARVARDVAGQIQALEARWQLQRGPGGVEPVVFG